MSLSRVRSYLGRSSLASASLRTLVTNVCSAFLRSLPDGGDLDPAAISPLARPKALGRMSRQLGPLPKGFVSLQYSTISPSQLSCRRRPILWFINRKTFHKRSESVQIRNVIALLSIG